ncbi:nucleoside-diphosphate sugar epimerase/dehydratase [Halomonas kalidii]|uniref:Polysaccharide biosynthesis protein CapD-like domain-containing protein n=1 Tax=Halomonas kalidii TaxID=3043293 RepID=A0ABT6VJM4_9GAMM|nr:hypothetical protein [Halomonas kalidii]MDI5934182.1 hypothetical protein [Halomonas kalidii]
MTILLNRLFHLPRTYKRVIQLLTDTALLAMSFQLAMMLRLDSWPPLFDPRAWLVLLVTIPISLMLFIRPGFYRAVIRYMSQKAIRTILIGVAASAMIVAIINVLMGLPLPRSVPFIYAMLAILTVGGVRFFLRSLYLHSLLHHKTRVVIYGAGAAGAQLVTSLSHGCEYLPIADLVWKEAKSSTDRAVEPFNPTLPRQTPETPAKAHLGLMKVAAVSMAKCGSQL